MPTLKTLIEQHEDWLTDRVVHYAQQRDFTQYSSTLREAWRISIRGLSRPLAEFLEAAQSEDTPSDAGSAAAIEFGVTQGKQHRARGVALEDFVGLLKLYRNAFLDLAAEKADDREMAWQLQKLIIAQFDAIEAGLLGSWSVMPTSAHLKELQVRNRELTNEKNKYLTVFESIAEPAILLGPDGQPSHVNAAANRTFLAEFDPGAGYYGDLNNPLLKATIRKILDAVEVAPGPVALDTPNGRRSFEVSVQEMLDISKKFAGSVVILQDITAYQKAIDAALEADRAKSVFLDTVSHEIRTPINNILGLTCMLGEKDLHSDTLKHLRSIRASGEVLSALIENVLGLSRAEANALQLVEQSFDLEELCSALTQVLDLEKSRHSVPLNINIAPDVPTALFGDAHKLRHVLMNLFSNAMKHTATGSVTLSVSRGRQNDTMRGYLLFEVADTGCGIPPEAVESLFEPFVQVKSPQGAPHAGGGSGLGLAICRHMVEFLGGQITYEPNPIGGSIFSFEVPFQLSDPQKSSSANTSDFNILMVEDDPVNAIVVEGYLTELGNNVTLAAGFEEAVEALEVGGIDFVITDFKLGTHTGLDVVEQIRKSKDRDIAGLPVLLMTAALSNDALNRLQGSEAVHVIEKPFFRNELGIALSGILHREPEPVGAPHEKSPSALSQKDLNRLLSDLGFERCMNVVSSFQCNLPSMLSGMQARLEVKDMRGLGELLHRLVSASGFVGGKRLVEHTKILSKLCKEGDMRPIREGLQRLMAESEALLQELEAWRQRVEEAR